MNNPPVLTSIAAGVVVLDKDLKVRSWNRGAVDLWGLRADEVLEEPFFELDFGLPTDALLPVVQRCLETRKRSGPVAVEALNRIGRSITCDVFFSPFDRHNCGVVLMMEESRSDNPE
ncbi:PAS domain S-box-containing protein [Streptomyces sp. V4I8]|uniref:PAS domain-containing protein n=1 Tax=Streptomyces sp. V4I8 TaxID=3156469 RepID=UPI003512E6AC